MNPDRPILTVLGGLPGTGKTTIARHLTEQLHATHVRIDAIEQALRSTLGRGVDIGETGYVVGYAISETNLVPGHRVVADCVNPLEITRAAWRGVAERANAIAVEVELTCSDAIEHRRRVENRASDIPGLILPSWVAVVGRAYEPWSTPVLQIDTARMSDKEATELIRQAIDKVRRTAR